MDNLCHTLVGAAIGEAGLKRTTRFGNVALMVAANLPDIDVLVFATDMPSVAFRRGWTHGIAAQLLLPVVLTAILLFVAKRKPSSPRASDDDRATGPPVRAGWLLALSFIGIYSHVFLDLLNNYGVRLLAPLDWRWLYGDAVFIIDPWLWLALGAGVWLARRRQMPRAANGALVFAVCYIVAMVASARAAREVVTTAWRDLRGIAPHALMVGPVPLTPFTREVIVDAGDHYERGRFSWSPTSVTFEPEQVPKNDQRPEVAAARALSPRIRGFLVWARFPFWTLTKTPEGTRVTVRDMRFTNRGDAFAASVVVRSSGGEVD